MASKIVVGGTYTLTFTLTKDGGVFDLTDATVTLYARRPNRTLQEVECEVTDEAGGVVQYENAASFFNAAGTWVFAIKVEQGTDVLPSDEFVIQVFPFPPG